MSIKNLPFFLILCSLSATVFADNYRINDETVPFIYDAYSEIKTPLEELATIISRDYRDAKDEFTRHDLFLEIKPILDKRIKEAAGKKIFTLRIGGELGEYDFDKKAFKTDFNDQTFVPFRNHYAAKYINMKDVRYIPIAFEEARVLSSRLAKSRDASFEFIGEIVRAKEGILNYHSTKILELKITKLSVVLKPDVKIGEINFK